MNKLSPEELDAILAGLRLLAASLDSGAVRPDDGDIGSILTNSGKHAGLTADQIDTLCERLN